MNWLKVAGIATLVCSCSDRSGEAEDLTTAAVRASPETRLAEPTETVSINAVECLAVLPPGNAVHIGEVASRGTIDYSFNVINRGSVVLDLQHMETSCACQSVDLAPATLHPNAVSVITIRAPAKVTPGEMSIAAIMRGENREYGIQVFLPLEFSATVVQRRFYPSVSRLTYPQSQFVLTAPDAIADIQIAPVFSIGEDATAIEATREGGQLGRQWSVSVNWDKLSFLEGVEIPLECSLAGAAFGVGGEVRRTVLLVWVDPCNVWEQVVQFDKNTRSIHENLPMPVAIGPRASFKGVPDWLILEAPSVLGNGIVVPISGVIPKETLRATVPLHVALDGGGLGTMRLSFKSK